MRNPVKIALKKANVTSDHQYSVPESLKNYYTVCDNREEKILALLQALPSHKEDKIMIFMNTCSSVDFYAKVLKLLFKDIPIFDIHG